MMAALSLVNGQICHCHHSFVCRQQILYCVIYLVILTVLELSADVINFLLMSPNFPDV